MAREFCYVVPDAIRVFGFGLSAALSRARMEVGAARESESTALATLSIMGYPASNILVRSEGPAAPIVSRKGFSAKISLRVVGCSDSTRSGHEGRRDK